MFLTLFRSKYATCTQIILGLPYYEANLTRSYSEIRLLIRQTKNYLRAQIIFVAYFDLRSKTFVFRP